MFEKIILTPFQKFVKIESFSGIILFSATIIAIIWANSPLGHIYQYLKNYELGFVTENFKLYKPLVLWVNDGLMTIFFFLIGLEIKRELLIGELNSPRKAAFPFFAALGGMVLPVSLFLLLNNNPNLSDGWGVPMATDIAFSLAILQLLGKRVPISLKVFLTAFAIIDDLGAVLVIALFYSTGIKWILLLYAAILFIVLAFLPRLGYYSKYAVLIIGIVIWYLFLKAGIHPTIAGVLLAFTVPIRQKINVRTFSDRLCEFSDELRDAVSLRGPILSAEQLEKIDDIEEWTVKVQSPLQHLEHKLHNWVAYLIMPAFALANAGILFSQDMSLNWQLSGIIAVSLFAGKMAGIPLLSYLGLKLKLTSLPDDMNFKQVIGVAALAGVGFTMSIFIANLAFANNPAYMDSAKVGIIAGSVISGLTGYMILRSSPERRKPNKSEDSPGQDDTAFSRE